MKTKKMFFSIIAIVIMVVCVVTLVQAQSETVGPTIPAPSGGTSIDCSYVTYYIHDENDNVIGSYSKLVCNWLVATNGGTNHYLVFMRIAEITNKAGYRIVIPNDTKLSVKEGTIPNGKSLMLKEGNYLYNPARGTYIGKAVIR